MILRPRRAFTLVELLVVIVIIAILMALLIPAVGSSIAQARRAQCMNNQREISNAVLLYSSQKQYMPPALSLSPDKKSVFGWVQGMYAYLGRSDLISTPNVPVSFPLVVCPSDSSKLGLSGGPLSYVVNGGCYNNYNAPPGTAIDYPANGSWSIGNATPGNPNPDTAVDFIARHDGVTYTVSHSENLDAGVYIPPGSTAEYTQCILWDPSAPLRFNQDVASGKPLDNAHARPSSNHPGGVVMTFCDSHTQFVGESIDYRVYATLMTCDGADAAPPGQTPFQPNQYSVFQVAPLDAAMIPSR